MSRNISINIHVIAERETLVNKGWNKYLHFVNSFLKNIFIKFYMNIDI